MAPAAAVPLAVALLSAALMGMAIQRGATCMVAAVDDAVTNKRFSRAGALAEAALWVGGLVAIAGFFGWFEPAPGRVAVTGWTFAGGALLGLGAWINRACVFGAVARIGSGQWAWLATPAGFFLGCLVPAPAVAASGSAAPPGFPAAVLAVLFAGFLIWRAIETLRAPSLLAHVWHPHRATLLIAVTFVTAMLTVGMWAYTDALAALARSMDGMNPQIALRGAMVLALLGGAVLGGWIAGALRWQPPGISTAVRCLVGGAMMGYGGLLVPGSNDGLIMLGLPLLLPHAWVAVGTMALTIAAAIGFSRAFQGAARTRRKGGRAAQG